ncbi:hypothetical protein M514_02914 [Trichuris suis]|uniref:Uncharacterized protein n=1 Tax=Trichuris suis TaxID=68888 RepID=A0A085NB14_9BILA|nr:hypothetical protein M513_02914 [Trichuris suis]KFD66660.1 hypothetical protein M514_02914 [Trichuris suis]
MNIKPCAMPMTTTRKTVFTNVSTMCDSKNTSAETPAMASKPLCTVALRGSWTRLSLRRWANAIASVSQNSPGAEKSVDVKE